MQEGSVLKQQPLEANDDRPATALLYAALTAERVAVESFLDTLQLHIITPLQEAWLDSLSPLRCWWPDWWNLTYLLAVEHDEPPVSAAVSD